jgi:hypothetical protein
VLDGAAEPVAEMPFEGPRVDDKGIVHEKGWDGEYRPAEDFFGPKEANVKRGVITGERVPAKDWLGNQKHSADGRPLYEAEPDTSPALFAALLAIAAVIALAVIAMLAWIFAKAIGWWWPRVRRSIEKDVADRRLSWTTLGFAAPLLILVLLIVASAINAGTGAQFPPVAGGGTTDIAGAGPIEVPTSAANQITEPVATSEPPAATLVPATPAPAPTAPFRIPTRAFLLTAFKQSMAQGNPGAAVAGIGEVDMVQDTGYGLDAVACASVTYKINGSTRTGIWAPILEPDGSGVLHLNTSARMVPSIGTFFSSLASCVDQALGEYGSWVVAKLPGT